MLYWTSDLQNYEPIHGCCFKSLNCGNLLGSDRKLKFIPSSPSSSYQELGSGPNLWLPSLAFTLCHQGHKIPLCCPPPNSMCTRTQCQGCCLLLTNEIPSLNSLLDGPHDPLGPSSSPTSSGGTTSRQPQAEFRPSSETPQHSEQLSIGAFCRSRLHPACLFR